MRQRITFLHKPQDGVDPAALTLTDRSIHGPVLPAVREDRLTLALDELPDALRQVLESCHELHISWVSPSPYDTVSPLLARRSPGFHLFYTPGPHTAPADQLCAALKEAFGPLDCKTAEASFTALPHDRFSHAAAYQYYHPLDSLGRLITYATATLCPPAAPADDPAGHSCAARLARLATASTFDLAYDAVSHALQLTATWPHADQPLAVAVAPGTAQQNHRIEVGVLTADAAVHPTLEPHEIGMVGALVVLGQDARPSGTMFKFPARHRRIEGGAFRAAFAEPAGLHPTLRLALNAQAVTPPPVAGSGDGGGDGGGGDEQCALHAYLTLPRAIFADRYQLADALFLGSKNLSALRYLSQPVDLEAPAYVMDLWGSAMLLELAPPPPPSPPSNDWTAEIPLHLRYLPPTAGGYAHVDVPHPAVFWACTTGEGTKFPPSPFERANLGYDGLFGPRTVFWHVEPQASGRLASRVRVPVLDSERAGWVSAGTAAVVLLGFGWIAWSLLRLYLRTGYGPAKLTERLERAKKTQ